MRLLFAGDTTKRLCERSITTKKPDRAIFHVKFLMFHGEFYRVLRSVFTRWEAYSEVMVSTQGLFFETTLVELQWENRPQILGHAGFVSDKVPATVAVIR